MKNKILQMCDGCESLIAVTTRERRVNEVNGKDKYFLTEEEFEAEIESIDVITQMYGARYGFWKKDLSRKRVQIVELYYKDIPKMKKYNVKTILITTSHFRKMFSALVDRYGVSKKLIKRICTDCWILVYLRFHKQMFDYTVKNDYAVNGIKSLKQIVDLLSNYESKDVSREWKNDELYEMIGGELEEVTGLSERFPLRIFNQKQLFEMTKDPENGDYLENYKTICEELTNRNSSTYSKKFRAHLNNLFENDYSVENEIYMWLPEDLVRLELKTGRNKYISIDAGSAGQRTSAILTLLLQISKEPIIIDQPEDDLDTKNITDFIVKGINEKKQSQQIIVVTHNPNIVVNTNSEQVIHMEFAGGEINASHSGALQDFEIRDAICDVMEGGREALESRYYRITKALE